MLTIIATLILSLFNTTATAMVSMHAYTVGAIERNISVTYNKDTGLTDFDVLGKTFSADVQPLDYTALND